MPLAEENQNLEKPWEQLDNSIREWAKHRDAVRLELEKIIARTSPSLRNIIRYHMGWSDPKGRPSQGKSGKYIRSILHILSCQAVGGDIARVLPSAATVEFVHNFSLIHDDIQDGSHERHGRPTVWKLWGKSQAINIGDLMFSLASLALVGLRDSGVSSEDVVYSFRLLAEACEELCEGQYLDIQYERQIDVTLENYFDMISKKTAALIAVSASLGVYLGGGKEKVPYFHRFGAALGMAYQVRDDILGIWGKRENTGKSVEEDIRRKKKTLPVVYALRESKDKAELGRLYSQRYIRSDDIPKVIEILNQSGARIYAENLVEQYYRQALEWLEATCLSTERQGPLRKLAYYLVQRDR